MADKSPDTLLEELRREGRITEEEARVLRDAAQGAGETRRLTPIRILIPWAVLAGLYVFLMRVMVRYHDHMDMLGAELPAPAQLLHRYGSMQSVQGFTIPLLLGIAAAIAWRTQSPKRRAALIAAVTGLLVLVVLLAVAGDYLALYNMPRVVGAN